MNIIITFIILSIINVIFSTVRSIATIKSGKTIASIMNGGYFAFYNIMLIYTVANFPMITKCIITFVCNVIGVYIVKFVEEKMQKDKLWKIEVTVPTIRTNRFFNALDSIDIPYNAIMTTNKYTVVNIYCKSQAESHATREIIKRFDVKYFASESKIL